MISCPLAFHVELCMRCQAGAPSAPGLPRCSKAGTLTRACAVIWRKMLGKWKGKKRKGSSAPSWQPTDTNCWEMLGRYWVACSPKLPARTRCWSN